VRFNTTEMLVCLTCNGLEQFHESGRRYVHTAHDCCGSFHAGYGRGWRRVWQCQVCGTQRVYGTEKREPVIAPIDEWSWLPHL
jgi:hypothetical protein